MMSGEVEVTMEIYLKTRYAVSDLDNFSKPLIDILEKAEYIENDNKITALHCYKYKTFGS